MRPVALSNTFSVTCAVTRPGRSERMPVIRLAAITLPAVSMYGDAGRVSTCGSTYYPSFVDRATKSDLRCWPFGSRSGSSATLPASPAATGASIEAVPAVAAASVRPPD